MSKKTVVTNTHGLSTTAIVRTDRSVSGVTEPVIPDNRDAVNYINLTTPSTSLINADDGEYIAACLKIQIGDNVPAISSFIVDKTMGAWSGTFTTLGVTRDQVALGFLLESIMTGQAPWGYIELPLVEEVTFYTFGLMPSDTGESVPSSFAISGLNKDLLRAALEFNVAEYGATSDHLVDANVEDIQEWISANLPSYVTSATISDISTTITISRCTLSDIESVFVDGYPQHTDMFDAAKSLLTSQNIELNNKGLKPATYDAATDSIKLVSDYSITVKLPHPSPYN